MSIFFLNRFHQVLVIVSIIYRSKYNFLIYLHKKIYRFILKNKKKIMICCLMAMNICEVDMVNFDVALMMFDLTNNLQTPSEFFLMILWNIRYYYFFLYSVVFVPLNAVRLCVLFKIQCS